MAVEAADAYLAAARRPRELRERKKEIQSIAGALIHQYGAKLDDGSPNPEHDKRLRAHGMDLWMATQGLRWKGATANASAPAPTSAGGDSNCCWCDRPAYATKQTWDEAKCFWCAGPVCEVCANQRADNERVVQFKGRKILLPARAPTVPTEFDAPRRRRKRS